MVVRFISLITPPSKCWPGTFVRCAALSRFYLVVVALIAAYILKKTVIGRYVYAVGSNEVAAHLSGIKVQRVKIFVYAFCGLLTGIAGVILASFELRTTNGRRGV